MNQRRHRIVDAAVELVRRTGSTAFTMRDLAATASVSLATPYNLFGSKQAVMTAVAERDLALFRERLATRAVDEPLDRMFEVVALATEFFFHDPVFYRTIFSAAVFNTSEELHATIVPPREAFWREQARHAMDAGLIRDDIDLNLFGAHLTRNSSGVFQSWLIDDCPQHIFGARFGYALAMCLAAVATEQAAARILARIEHYQRQLIHPTAPEPANAPDGD